MGVFILSDFIYVAIFFIIVLFLSALGAWSEKRGGDHTDDIGAFFVIVCVVYWIVVFRYVTWGVG